VTNVTATNEQTPSDEALLAGMASGDESSTVAFLRRYQRRVFGLAVGILSDRGAAEDVAQEALFRAWKHAPIFDTRRGSVENWVLTITRNLSIDALRKQRSIPTDPDQLVALAKASQGTPMEDAVAMKFPPISDGPWCSRHSTDERPKRSVRSNQSRWAPPKRGSAPDC
jgi:RNA polymerase sigma factor (sigma-70 family)